MTTDFYKVLGVEKNASPDEIKSAYRKKAKEFHPDLNKSPDATVMFKQATEAYEVLSDNTKRHNYDTYGDSKGRSRGFAGSGPFDNPFSDFFSTMRSWGVQQNPHANHNGSDVEVNIGLTLEEVLSGVKKEIKYSCNQTCTGCSGSGLKAGKQSHQCTACNGTGQKKETVTRGFMQSVSIRACHDCNGSGESIKEADRCSVCSGKKYISEDRVIEVAIPKGMSDDQVIKIANEGNVGRKNGRNGSLLITVHYLPHKLFKSLENSRDLLMEIPITFAQATLGDKIQFKTLQGNLETVDIAPGTKDQQYVIKKGYGLPSTYDSVGDLGIVFKLSTPQTITDRQKELYKELYEIDKNEGSLIDLTS